VRFIITDKKELEERLKGRNSDLQLAINTAIESSKKENFVAGKLETQRSREQAILMGIGEGVISADNSQHITFINAAFTRLTGWTESEVIGKKMTEVLPLVDENGKIISEEDRPLMLVLKTGSMITNSKMFYVLKNGTKLPIWLNVTPIMKDKKVEGIIEIFHERIS
jgi:PAS domain S-box-containing protein